MRSALTLVLGVTIVWLLIDRARLQEQLIAKNQAEEEAAENARKSNSSWLNAHIEKGAKSLEKKPPRR